MGLTRPPSAAHGVSSKPVIPGRLVCRLAIFALVSPVAVLDAWALAAGILQVMETRVPNHAEMAANAAIVFNDLDHVVMVP